MRIPAIGTLILFAASAVAQTVGPAIPLTNTRYSTSGEAAVATLAANGRTFIAAWTTPTGIRVSRIDGTTASMGIPLGGGPTADAPAVAAHGDGYVVGWNDGVRYLDANGNPFGGVVSIGTPTPRSRVASNGSAVMLAYPRATFQFEILGAFIAPSGEVLKKDVHIGTNPGLLAPLPFAAAGDKNGFAFISEDAGDIQIKFFDTDGNFRSTNTLDGTESTFPPVPRHAAIATDGRAYLMVWTTEEHALAAAQFRSDGTFIGKTMLLPPGAGHSPAQPSLAFDGESFVCGYLDGGDINLIHIAATDLAVTQLAPVKSAGSPRMSVAASNGTAVVAWARDVARLNNLGLGGVVFARRISADATLADTFPVSVGAHDQTFAASASNGTDILLTWTEGNSQQVSLMGGMLRADGTWRELGRLGRGGGTPLAASDGHDFLVIGVDGAFRIAANGEILDRTELGFEKFVPTGLAWSGHEYVAVGDLDPSAQVSPGLGVVSISASGVAGGLRNIRPPVDEDRAEKPSIVSTGDGFLVTFIWWEPPCIFGCFFPVPPGSGAHAIRLSPSLDRVGLEIAAYPADTVSATSMAFNSDESILLVVNDTRLDAVRIARNGTVLGKTRINENTPNKTAKLGTPAIIPFQSDFIVTWREVGLPGKVASGNAWFSAVHADGTFTAPVAFDPGNLSTGDPLLVLDQSGSARVIRPMFLSDAPYFGAERLVAHALEPTELPETPALEIRANGTGVLLAWNQVRGALGYRVEHKNARHDWQEIEALLPPDSLTLPVTLDRGVIYSFRVKAIGWGGASYSNVASYDPTRRRAIH